MPDINAQLPDYLTRTLPTQASSLAQDQVVSANLLHGVQSRQRQQQIDMQQQEQNAMLPIRAKYMENQTKLQALSIQQGLQQQQDELDTAEAVNKMGDYLQGAFRVGNAGDPIVEAGLLNILKRYPRAQKTPAFAQLWESLQSAKAIDAAENLARIKTQPTAAIQDVNVQIQDELRAGTLKNDPRSISLRHAELMNARNNPKGLQMDFDPTTGRPIHIGTGGGGATTAMQTDAQKQILTSEKAFNLASDLQTSLSPENVGAIATGKQEILNTWLTQIAPGSFDPKLSSDVEKLVILRGALARSISENGRFSDKDRQRAEEALPRPGVRESYPNAMIKLNELKRMLVDQAKVDAKAIGAAQPEWTLSVEDIKNAFQAKKITGQKAHELINKYHPMDPGVLSMPKR